MRYEFFNNKAAGSRIGLIACILCLIVPDSERMDLSLSYGQTHRSTAPMCSPHFAHHHHQLSSAEQSKSTNQQIGLESPNNIVSFSFVFGAIFLRVHLTVTPALASNHIQVGCVFIGSSGSEPIYERTPAKS